MKHLLVVFLILCFGGTIKAQKSLDVFKTALQFYKAENYSEADSTMDKAIAMAEKEKIAKKDMIYLLIWKAKILTRIDNAKAEESYLNAKNYCEKNLGKNFSDYGTILNNLAVLYKDMGQYTKALPIFTEALAIIKKNNGVKNLEYILCLNNIAEVHHILGEYDLALPLFLESIERFEKDIGKNDPQYGITLNNLAQLYCDMGQYQKAEDGFNDALHYLEISYGKTHSLYNDALCNMAKYYQQMGQYDKALSLYKEALENIGKTLGKDNPHYGVVLSDLGMFYQEMGQYQKALNYYNGALENCEKSLGKDHPFYGTYLSNLALVYHSMGQYEKSVLLNLEAYENVKKSLGTDHPQYAITLNNIGTLLESLGKYDDAKIFLIEALSIAEKKFGKDHEQYGTGLSNLALLYQDMGKYDLALPLYLEALGNVEKNFGKEHSTYGNALSNLAVLYQLQGEYAKALPFFTGALANLEKSLGKDHPDYGIRLNNLAEEYMDLGQYRKAFDYFQMGIDANKKYLSENLLGIAEELKTGLIVQNSFYTQMLQSLVAYYPDSFKEKINYCWEDVAFYKGLSMKSGNLLNQKLRESKDSLTLSTLSELTAYRNMVNKELLKSKEARSEQLPEFQKKAKNLEDKLLARSSDYKELKQALFAGFRELQATLKPNEAAIEITTFTLFNKDWKDTVIYAAYIIKPGQNQPQFLTLFTEAVLQEVLNSSTSDNRSINKNYLRRGATLLNEKTSTVNLYQLVWRKLEPYLKGVNLIYLSPGGFLSKVSFAAMQDSSGRYLADRFQINYMLNLTDLLFTKPGISPASFLLVGGINYNYTPKQKKDTDADTLAPGAIALRGLRGSDWSYLAGTQTEVTHLNAIINAGKQKVVLFNGDKATETNIKMALQNEPSVWHIATHGFYIPLDAKQDHKKTEKENNYKAQDDPMNRCGLLLAGSNYAWKNGSNPYEEDDGILLAKEISTMNLSGTQLVVLSACETGLGDMNGSEGVMGLQRALKMAGVSYQITTLWQVPDLETVEFMESFYSGWLQGTTVEKAFNTAQNKMSRKYPAEPYKWGAFVLYH